MKNIAAIISCAFVAQITAYAQSFGYTAPAPSYSSNNHERIQAAYAEIAQQRQLDALRARQQEIESRQRQIESQQRLQK